MEEKKCNFVETAKRKTKCQNGWFEIGNAGLSRYGNGYNKPDIRKRLGEDMVTIKQIAQEVRISIRMAHCFGRQGGERKISTAAGKILRRRRDNYQPNMAARSAGRQRCQ
ncbi:MAG: hypothetical protein ACLS88_10280 [Faecalibacterium sp.]